MVFIIIILHNKIFPFELNFFFFSFLKENLTLPQII